MAKRPSPPYLFSLPLTSTDLGSRIDAKLQLWLLAKFDRETFHHQGAEAAAGATTKGMEDKKSLRRGTTLR